MKIRRMFMRLLAISLCVGLCACGGSKTAEQPADTDPTQQATTANTEATSAPETTEAAVPELETTSWGDWTVGIPAGYTLEGGDFFDENDPRCFSVKKSDFTFFDFNADGEEQIMNHYNYNKNTYTNEQKDVQGTFGGNEWIGFQYSDGFGGYGFEAYATVGGELIRVSAVGFAFDDAIAGAVLSSLKYTPAE